MSAVISKITKARVELICDHPFFASLLLPMPLTETSDVPTMATDGESILINPTWTEKLTRGESLFVLAHEKLNCVFDHMGRRGSRSPNRWNQAADFIINEILVNDKIGDMPKGGLYDPNLVKKGGATAEGVYNLIPEENEKKGAGEKGGALDQVHDAGSKNGTEKTDAAKIKKASADLKVRVLAAKNFAKAQGKLSAGLERLIDDLVKPRVDWKAALLKFFSEKIKTEYSYARPKRRFLGEDFYLPSLTGNRIGKVSIAVDCSGSISPKVIDAFAAEINSIRELVRPREIEVIYFDSQVTRTDIFTDDDALTIKPIGGGGTAFSPVFNHINASDEIPACVVFLTDLYCDDFGPKPDYPVLWCVLDGAKNAPFGEILEVSADDDSEAK